MRTVSKELTSGNTRLVTKVEQNLFTRREISPQCYRSRMTKAEREHATKLEEYLRAWWWRKNPGPLTASYISVDGKSMTFSHGDDRTVRKLSEKGREYIRTGGLLPADEEEFYLQPVV